MEDSFRVRGRLDAGGVERAVIVGAGYIGLEMADAFIHRGLRVTLVSRLPTVMPSVDASLGEIIRTELEHHGIDVATGIQVGEIIGRDGELEIAACQDSVVARNYPGAHRLHVRITGDRRTGRLLGAQIVGHWQAEVSKRIDIFATALFHGMTIDGTNDLDLTIRRQWARRGTRCRRQPRRGCRRCGHRRASTLRCLPTEANT